MLPQASREVTMRGSDRSLASSVTYYLVYLHEPSGLLELFWQMPDFEERRGRVESGEDGLSLLENSRNFP